MTAGSTSRKTAGTTAGQAPGTRRTAGAAGTRRTATADPDVQEMRRFNRFYTNLIGALDYGRHLYTPYTLTEARVLYEVAHHQRVDAADLRASLSLDAGYLSRLLGKFAERELITRGRSDQDPRRQRITLTERGRETVGLLEERSQNAAGSLLERLPAADRARLVASMRTIRALLDDTTPTPPPASPASAPSPSPAAAPAPGPSPSSAPEVVLRTNRPGDLGWMVERNATCYAAEYGFDLSYEALVARIVAEYAEAFDPERDRTWIAELAGERVGAVMCVRDTRPGAARLRLLLVEPAARGHGVGHQLVSACVEFARSAGYTELVLWTNSVLSAARSIYQHTGFELVGEAPHHSFGQDLIGQDWRLVL